MNNRAMKYNDLFFIQESILSKSRIGFEIYNAREPVIAKTINITTN